MGEGVQEGEEVPPATNLKRRQAWQAQHKPEMQRGARMYKVEVLMRYSRTLRRRRPLGTRCTLRVGDKVQRKKKRAAFNLNLVRGIRRVYLVRDATSKTPCLEVAWRAGANRVDPQPQIPGWEFASKDNSDCSNG